MRWNSYCQKHDEYEIRSKRKKKERTNYPLLQNRLCGGCPEDHLQVTPHRPQTLDHHCAVTVVWYSPS